MGRTVLLVLPTVLASCGLLGIPTGHDVMGTLSGTAPGGGDVRLAFVGLSLDETVNPDVPQIDISLEDGGNFGVDFPTNPAWKVYQVIGYVDSHANRKYDAGEPRTRNNNKYLVYSRGGTTDLLSGLRAGWNLVTYPYTPGSVTQPKRVTGYDLSW
ncbi:hypothetical protein [Deinococcus aestuarii]|uniref:hypothetical protein n=1 Tax=Deinococcus aestuarii TaxID=2774531 RepID=UPI001C0B9A82|nr:hypothetical protein [Deinococcus aestuarii]